ncbi:GNAT family N-acetyltransferase [Clostridium sediminicola]|uniref:GNAT family N-acetyltransferase n=1 Tax=Clostridium sediminicola TaxID=3114879 RepID=UPI0031F24C56
MNSNLSYENLKEIKLKNGQCVILRRPRVEDAKEMIEYLNVVGGESDNLLFGVGDFHLTLEQEIEHIKKVNNDENTLMVIGVVDGKVISISQINNLHRKRIAHNSEISISVKKDYWRNGIGSAVMEELIKFAKNNGIIKNMSLGVKASNVNAIKLYEKFGFEKVGVHKNYFNVDGNYDDEILMDLCIDK